MLDATDELAPGYFDALCDTSIEAKALYNLHRNRVQSVRRNPEVPVDGEAP